MSNRSEIPLLGVSLALGAWLMGCQPAGPGVTIEVRAEPKQGYKLPEPDDVGYGGSTAGDVPAGHDHNFHLIDYRNLDGIIVWIEPEPATTAASAKAPLNADVEIRSGSPAVRYDPALASVGGEITFAGINAPVVLHTEAGEIFEVSPASPVFKPTAPGFIEILTDDSDQPAGAVYVTPTAWARKVRNKERVTFAPLPPGKYRVTTWHPILPGSSQLVEVGPDKLAKLTLTVGVNSLPKPKP